MTGRTPVHQEFVANVNNEISAAEKIGDVEYVYYNETSKKYETDFGPDLPQKYSRPYAYNSVVSRDSKIYLVYKTSELKTYSTNLLELDENLSKWKLHEIPMTPRTNGTVFLYQDKIYIIGGKWQNPSVEVKTDAPIPHDIVYFNGKNVARIDSIQQQQLEQDSQGILFHQKIRGGLHDIPIVFLFDAWFKTLGSNVISYI